MEEVTLHPLHAGWWVERQERRMVAGLIGVVVVVGSEGVEQRQLRRVVGEGRRWPCCGR